MPKPPAKKSAAKRAKKAPPTPQAMAREMMRVLEQHLGPDDLIMPDDLKALMVSLESPQAGGRISDLEADARDEAQQIAFEAMEAETEVQARKLAKRALKLDPDCVDALVVMTELDAHSTREKLEGLQKAVAAGERALGAKFIDENEGRFWLLIETRPYMRALQSLAEGYRSQGIKQDAITLYEKMLGLNPNDNQGVRDPLLGLYLESGDLNDAALMLTKYKDDASASFAWARVLERLLSGDRDGAAAMLKKARKANPHVELFLASQKPLPENLPEMYSPGSEAEAVLCLSYLGGAWAEHADAARWLFEQLARPAKTQSQTMPGKRV